MEVYLQWVTEAWNSLSKDIIVESFKHCAISTELDGSEDLNIHCLKADSGIVWTDGIEKLRLARENRDNVEQPFDAIDLAEDLLNMNMEAAEIQEAEEVPEAHRYETGLEEERDEDEYDDGECTYKPDCRCFLCGD